MSTTANIRKYTISGFSKQTGLAASTLRYYESEGLITPSRYPNGRRYYTEEDLAWLKFLQHLKGTGMTIEELKKYIHWREEGDRTIPQRLALLKATKSNFLEQFAEIQHHLQILNDKINWYEAKEAGIVAEDEGFAAYLQHLGHHE